MQKQRRQGACVVGVPRSPTSPVAEVPTAGRFSLEVRRHVGQIHARRLRARHLREGLPAARPAAPPVDRPEASEEVAEAFYTWARRSLSALGYDLDAPVSEGSFQALQAALRRAGAGLAQMERAFWAYRFTERRRWEVASSVPFRVGPWSQRQVRNRAHFSRWRAKTLRFPTTALPSKRNSDLPHPRWWPSVFQRLGVNMV